jgi:hypothetical protein
LGAFSDQHPGRQFILKDPMAALNAGRLYHSTRHFAKWISDTCDRASLREYRSPNDSQRDSPARRSPLFRAFAHSTFSSVVVAAQRRRPDPTIGVALSFTDRSNLGVCYRVAGDFAALFFRIVQIFRNFALWCP